MTNNFDISNAVDKTATPTFSPEIWSMEIVAAYKSNIVMAGLVTTLNHNNKPGDTINIPSPDRDAATTKSENAFVTLIAHTDSNIQVTLDQHYHYARLYEDVPKVQNISSLRRFFVDDAGYALAKQVDSSLHGLAATWANDTAYEGSVIGSDGSTKYDADGGTGSAGNGAAISDAGMRRIVQHLDDNDTPGRNRYLVIPPIEKRRLMGEGRFTEQAFTGEAGMGNSIRNGLVGDLYGVEVFVSSNCVTITADDGSTTYRAALCFQKEALCLVEQIRPRVQRQYKLEALGDLLVADTLYGVKTLRGGTTLGNGAVGVIVPAT